MMEEAAKNKRRPLKISIKLKRKKSLNNSSTTADHLDNVVEPHNASGSVMASSQDQLELGSAEVVGNCSSENKEPTLSSENCNNQLVLYNPAGNGSEAEPHVNPIGYRTPTLSRPHPFSNQTPRVLPAVGAFTVQCANCFKWRIIPTKEKYEEVREHITEQPFLCETAREWRPEISCEDPPDIEPDGSRLWAIDKPNITQPPAGWERLLRIRGEGSSKFADVYYVTPSGKRLRSMVEIQRYLDEHQEYVFEGVNLSQFSFQTPRPLQENYVRKRSARATPPNGVDNLDASPVEPITWGSPDVVTDLQLSQSGLSTQSFKASGLSPEIQSGKRKRKSSTRRNLNGDIIHNPNEVNVEESHQL